MNHAGQKERWGSRWRIITAIVLLILLLLAGLAAIMGLGRKGRLAEIATRQAIGGKQRYCYNTQLGRALSKGTHQSELTPFAFDVKKDARTYRIFVLGGLVAQGFPDEYYDFGRILELLLEDQYAGTDFEVINVALRGADSDALLEIAESCSGFEPDLLILHVGLNELSAPDLEFAGNIHRICLEGARAGARVLLSSGQVADQVQIGQMLQSIAEEDADAGTAYVDVGQAIEDTGSYGVIEREFFYDRIHYRFSGNYVVARALLDAIRPSLPDGITRHASGKEPLALSACEERLVYTDFERYLSTMRVMKSLNKQQDAELVAKLEGEAAALKQVIEPQLKELLGRYKAMTEQHPDDWRLTWKVADYAYRFYNNPRLAVLMAKRVLQSLPHTGSRVILMKLAIGQGQLAEAEQHARALIQLNPSRADCYFDLGEIYKIRGEYEEAINQFSRGIKLQPGNQSVVAYTYMAELYEAIGQPQKAIDALYEAIENGPRGHAEAAYVNLGLLLGQEGRADEAVKVLRTAVEAFAAEDIPRRDDVVRLLEKLGRQDLAAKLATVSSNELSVTSEQVDSAP